MPSWRLADLQVDLMCSDQDRFEVSVMPRYFTDGEGGIWYPAMLRLMGGACLDLLMQSSLVLEWLGVRPCT